MLSAAVQVAAEHGHPSGPLGLPMWIWQLVNLVGFFALLLYFVARPVTEMFRKKQLEVEARAREARERRAAAAKLETEIHERMARRSGVHRPPLRHDRVHPEPAAPSHRFVPRDARGDSAAGSG